MANEWEAGAIHSDSALYPMLQRGGRTNVFVVALPTAGLKSKPNILSIASSAIHQGALGEYLRRTVANGLLLAKFSEKEWQFFNVAGSLNLPTFII